ncbi:MAG: AAC(3) family N-acetyltransferase, partial [Anaerolineales bacterium]|nr:AAC(3) family N-acetyltransferase [Anaerolineales bacterium]
EYRADYPGRKVIETNAPVLVDGRRQWVTMKDVDKDVSDFRSIGHDFEHAAGVRPGRVGNALVRLMSQRALVDFGVRWIEKNRSSATDPL